MTLVDPTKEAGFTPETLKQIVASPFSRIGSRLVSFLFVFEGYLFEFYAPKIPSALLSKPGVLKRSAVWYIPKKNIFDVPELLKLMVSGHAKSKDGLVTFES